MKGEFKWLNKHLSLARDLDVSLRRIQRAHAPQPQTHRLDQAWRQAHDISHRHLNRALRSKRYRTLVHATAIWLAKGNELPADPKAVVERKTSSLATYSVRRLSQWYKKLLKESRTLKEMNRNQRHRLRIRSKRLRYALEFFRSLFPSEYRSKSKVTLECLRKIQKHLGQLNDMEQGRSIATTLTKSARGDFAGLRSPFPTGRKIEKRMIKVTLRTFRQMQMQKLFRV